MHLERHFADFVEEESSFIALLEAADALGCGSGKSPFFVTEKLAL